VLIVFDLYVCRGVWGRASAPTIPPIRGDYRGVLSMKDWILGIR
jgi:hypothetical protein